MFALLQGFLVCLYYYVYVVVSDSPAAVLSYVGVAVYYDLSPVWYGRRVHGYSSAWCGRGACGRLVRRARVAYVRVLLTAVVGYLEDPQADTLGGFLFFCLLRLLVLLDYCFRGYYFAGSRFRGCLSCRESTAQQYEAHDPVKD